MAHFVFQLEGVLRHRKQIERQKQRDLAVVRAEYAKLETDLSLLNDSVQAANRDLCENHLVGTIDLNFIGAHRRFLIATQRQATELMKKMAVLQRQVLEAQQVLIEAAKQRKIIEKLKEKHQARWQEDMNRRELAEQDEISMRLAYADFQSDSADNSGMEL